jgi:hypothetical protein
MSKIHPLLFPVAIIYATPFLILPFARLDTRAVRGETTKLGEISQQGLK